MGYCIFECIVNILINPMRLNCRVFIAVPVNLPPSSSSYIIPFPTIFAVFINCSDVGVPTRTNDDVEDLSFIHPSELTLFERAVPFNASRVIRSGLITIGILLLNPLVLLLKDFHKIPVIPWHVEASTISSPAIVIW